MHLRKYLLINGLPALLLLLTATKAFAMAENEEIGLQNLRDRTIVHCHSNGENSAEACARYFESKGYVRFRDIPYKTANYDFLKVDTYPTRRWRDSETTPRW